MKGSYLSVCTIILLATLFSCEKSEIVDLDLNNRKSILNNISQYSYIPRNLGDIVFIDLNEFKPTEYFGIPALLAEEAKVDGEVVAKIEYNDELIKIYDEIYNTKSPKLHPGMFKLKNNGNLTIKKGNNESIDSLKLEVDVIGSFSEMGPKEYVIPVLIESKDPNIKLKSKFMFLRYVVDVKSFLAPNQLLYNIFGFQPSKDIAIENYQSELSPDKDLSFEFEIDDDKNFLEYYNRHHNTDYLELPNSNILTTNFFTFVKGNKKPTQTVSATLKNIESLDKSKTYIKAIKIKSVNGISSLSAFRIIFIYAPNSVNPTNEVLIGEFVDKSKWKIYASSTYSSSNILLINDGQSRTAWRSASNPKPHYLVIDFGEQLKIKGFRITPNYSTRSENFLKAEVWGSNDNLSWELIGKYSGPSTLSTSTYLDPDYKYLNFLKIMNFRYYKFYDIKATSTNYVGMSELDAIK